MDNADQSSGATVNFSAERVSWDQKYFNSEHGKCSARFATCNFVRKVGITNARVGQENSNAEARCVSFMGQCRRWHHSRTPSSMRMPLDAWTTFGRNPTDWTRIARTNIGWCTFERKREKLRHGGAKIVVKIKGKTTQGWIDSGSPVIILEIKR